MHMTEILSGVSSSSNRHCPSFVTEARVKIFVYLDNAILHITGLLLPGTNTDAIDCTTRHFLFLSKSYSLHCADPFYFDPLSGFTSRRPAFRDHHPDTNTTSVTPWVIHIPMFSVPR